MMRPSQQYSNVVGNDIYNHYSLFFWQLCFFCDQEFRRESGYRFQLQYNSPWVYSCSECSSSKDECNENVHLWKDKARRAFVNIESHFIQQCIYPDRDSSQWLAFLALNKKYVSLTYWSMDGYHCDALADYTKDLVWRDKEIIKWSTKEKIKEVSSFCCTNTTDIVSIWMEICGETDTTKKTWITSIKEGIK